MTKYDTTKVLPKRYAKLATKLWDIPDLYNSVIPQDDSQRYTKILSLNQNIEIFIVTLSTPSVIERKIKYIERMFPWIPTDHIIIIANKQLLKLDVLVEDNPKQLLGGDFQKILMTAPWNKNFNSKFNGCVRCNDWDEIYTEIMRILKAHQNIWDLMN